jgi:pilus assembly protein TadC
VTAGVPALLLLAAALAGWSPRDAPVRARLRRLATPSPPPRRGGRPALPASARLLRHLPPAVLGAATALLAGGPGGLLLGLLVGSGAGWLLHRARSPDAGRGDLGPAASRELPVACDLLAVCLAAGVPVGPALAAVGQAVTDPLRTHLLEVAALYRLGADPAHAWSGTPPALRPLGRSVARAGMSGSAVGGALRALAADLRAAERARGEAAVQRAGVWVLAPLGACFLPAFVCLGVVPLVLGLAAGVLG